MFESTREKSFDAADADYAHAIYIGFVQCLLQLQ